MNLHSSNKGMLGTVFVLLLFLLFAVAAMLLALFGAKIYEDTTADMEENSQIRSSLLYVANKLHAGDTAAGCGLTEIDGLPVLCIGEEHEGDFYVTCIYYYGGALREQFLLYSLPFDPAYGEEIVALSDFRMEPVAANKLKITAECGDKERSLTVSLRTGGAA